MEPLGILAFVLIVLGAALLLGLAVFCYKKHHQDYDTDKAMTVLQIARAIFYSGCGLMILAAVQHQLLGSQ